MSKTTHGWEVLDVQSIDVVAHKFDETSAVLNVPGMRAGDLWLKAGKNWYVGDQFMNLPAHMKGLFGLLFRFTDSTPGFKANGVARVLFTADKAAYKAWALDKLAGDGPAQLVPWHGPLVNGGALGPEMRRQLEASF